MDDRGALGLDADADARAREAGGAETKKGRVGRMLHAHDTRARPRFRDAADQLAQDRRQGMAGNGLEELDAEGRADPDHDLAGTVAGARRPHGPVEDALALGGLVHGLCSQHFLARKHVADRHDLLATRLAHAVAGARPQIVVGIVDGAEDLAVADHRRGLQIVA